MAKQPPAVQMKDIYNKRRFVVFVEIFYLIVLFAIAVFYLTDLRNAVHFTVPETLGSLPVGVPWFGALGAVMISLTGAFDHRDDWDPSWNLWHFTRPLIGISLAIISWLIFEAGILAVGPNTSSQIATANSAASRAVTAPSNLLYYLIAFVVGYRESIFRDLIKRVADVILTPSGGAPPPVISVLNPIKGAAAGGDTVTITGSGFAGTSSVRFGPTPALLRIDSDRQITATTPPGTGTVKITVTTNGGNVTGGEFTYE
ncbi:MAG TPA: IPT/TIG domain-containing protein [Gemmatimonadaceae bacterium]